jgi:hypothetical protein
MSSKELRSMAADEFRRIHLVHHTHLDVGYTDLPGEVRDQHLIHLDRVLDLCRGNAERAPAERFRWTCESAMLVRDYLAGRPASRCEELLECLRAGWIELMAFLTQPLTEVASAGELVDCVRYAVELGKREGFAVRCGMIDDIGGYAGRLPTVLSGLGVRYLVAGVGAFQVHLPWADLPHLFYLEAADGCRILIWNLGIDRGRTPQDMERLAAVYGQGTLYLVNPFAAAFRGVRGRGVELDLPAAGDEDEIAPDALKTYAELADRLRAEGYRGNEFMLQYGGDNRGPDAELVPLLARINRIEHMPEVVLTTPSLFFEKVEHELGDAIPVVRGVMTDPWNLRANPQPAGLKRYRAAQRLASAVELHTALAHVPAAETVPALADANWNMQLYADHTCGLSEWGWEKVFADELGCRAPAFDRYRESWASKRFYAESALRTLEELDRVTRQRIGGGLAHADGALIVWNRTAYRQAGSAEVYLGRGAPPLEGVRDAESGEPVPFRPLGPARYAVDVPPVPGGGWRILERCGGTRPQAPELRQVSEETRIAAGDTEFVFDKGGALRAVTAGASGRNLLDCSAEYGLGDVVYHMLEGVAPGPVQAGMARDWHARALPVTTHRVEVETEGAAVFRRVVVHQSIDGPGGCIGVRREYRIPTDGRSIEIRVRIDKPETDRKEALYVMFPFAGDGASLRFDQNIGSVEPGRDLIPGAMQDMFLCSSWCGARVHDREVLLACPDAPVVQFGGIRTGQWSDMLPFRAETNHVVCMLYHNLLNTDCAIWQDVLDEFRFVVCFDGGGAGTASAEVWASGACQPLIAQELGAAGPVCVDTPVGRGLTAASPDLRILAVRRCGADVLDVMLENCSHKDSQGCVEIGFGVSEAHLCSLGGRALGECDVSDDRVTFPLRPNQVALLQLKGLSAESTVDPVT